MKKMLLHMLFLMLIVTGIESCSGNQSPRSLFQGKDSDQWTSQGNVTLDNQLLVLNDEGSITLKKETSKILNSMSPPALSTREKGP